MKNEKLKKFFSSAAGRSAVILCAALVIGLAVYLNYRLFYDPVSAIGYGTNNMKDNVSDTKKTSDDTKTGTNAEANNDYFTSAALTRRQSRDEAIDVLKLVTDNNEATEEAKTDAQSKMSKIAVDIQNEANIESLIKAKGFEDCVAIISDNTVSVIVKAEELQAKDTAQILTAVYETTGILPENVSIIRK